MSRVDLRDGVHEVQRADDIVHLGVDRVLPVDHGVRSGPLLAEVHNGVGRHSATEAVNAASVRSPMRSRWRARHFAPCGDPLLQWTDRHKAVHAHFDVVLPPHVTFLDCIGCLWINFRNSVQNVQT